MKIPSDLIVNFITSEFKDAVKTSSGEYHFNSFYITDTKKKLYVSPKGAFICFKSGEKGSFLKLVKDYLGLNNISEAIKYLVDNYNFKATVEDDKIQLDNIKVVDDFLQNDKPVFFNDPSKLGIFGKQAYAYVMGRKLEDEYIPKMGYVFNNFSRYNGRVIVPFFEDAQMNYFLARAIDKKNKLRYLNPEKLNSKGVLFNIDKINDEVIICEGTFDAMSIVGDQAATCLLSADIGTEQIEKLVDKKVNSIIYVADNDETGHRQMDKNIKKMITYFPYALNVYTYDLPNGIKDLNELKIKTGKNYILKKECNKYGRNLFARSIF